MNLNDKFRDYCRTNSVLNIQTKLATFNGVIVKDVQPNYVIVRLPAREDQWFCDHIKMKYTDILHVKVIQSLSAFTDEELNIELKRRERKKNPTYHALMDSMRDRESPFVNVHMKNGVSYYQVYVVKIDYDTSNGRGSALLRPETSDREIEVDINEISQICKDNLLPLMTEYVMHRDPRARQAVIRMIAEGKTEKSYYDE